MLVRSWNLFHGNTLPPERRSHLEQMIRLAAADRPDVALPPGGAALGAVAAAAWSGMSVRHVVTRRAPLGTWLGGVITRLNNGLFGPARRPGQRDPARARSRSAGRAPLSSDRRAPRRAALLPRRPPRRPRDREPARDRRTSASRRSRPRRSPRRGVRDRDRGRRFPACSPATSTCVRSTCGSSRVGRRSGRGSTTCSCGAFGLAAQRVAARATAPERRGAVGSRSGGGDGRMTPEEARALFPVLERSRI